MFKFLLAIFTFCFLPFGAFAQCQYATDTLQNGQPFKQTELVNFGGGKFPLKNYNALISSKAQYKQDLLRQASLQEIQMQGVGSGNFRSTFRDEANQLSKEIEQLRTEQANDAGFQLFGTGQLTLFQGEKYIRIVYTVGSTQSATMKIGGIEKNSKLEFKLNDESIVTLYSQDDVAFTPYKDGTDGGGYIVWYKIDDISFNKLKNTTLESWSFYSLKGGYTFNHPNPFYFKKNLDCIN
jgi:hypothetical protein